MNTFQSTTAAFPIASACFGGLPQPTPVRKAQISGNVFVISWEDVLAPVGLLRERIGFDATPAALQSARTRFTHDVNLQHALAAIEEQALALLAAAAKCGPVFLVTQSCRAYFEATCLAFFPRLVHWLNNSSGLFLNRVEVVSAPVAAFSSLREIAAWRTSVFQRICQAAALSTEPVGVVSISAYDLDSYACAFGVRAMRPFPRMAVLPKCVRVSKNKLSLEEFYAQLRTLQGFVPSVAAHANAFSMEL